jgi:polyisoprenoid-binding protein YceI
MVSTHIYRIATAVPPDDIHHTFLHCTVSSFAQRQPVAAGRRAWRGSLIGLALLGVLGLPALAQTEHSSTLLSDGARYALKRDQSRISFSIDHFIVSSTRGQFTTFDGTLIFQPQAPEHGKVTVHVSPGSIDTGIAARDDHLRTADFFEIDKFPVATFASTSFVQTAGRAGRLVGLLTLHGVTKPIILDVTLQTADLHADRLKFSATGVLKRSEFGMNNFMGVIGDNVTLTVEAEFDKER